MKVLHNAEVTTPFGKRIISVIVSKSSLASQHVLNEIDNAYSRLPDLRFKPLRLDDIEPTPGLSCYLSRQHRMDAFLPPIKGRPDSFVDAIISEL